MQGFLVVVAACDSTSYKGIDRVPVYPAENADEAVAAEEYALGKYKSIDTNLIISLELAVELLRKFSSLHREFEIIWCSTEEGAAAACKDCETIDYGYDVASVTADYWSIVDDFSTSPWATKYRSKLNAFGLFGDRASAENYMNDYRLNNEPDSDSPFEVMQVAGVRLGFRF